MDERGGGTDGAPDPSGRGDLAIVLSGGGARGAYQAGVLRGLARHLPELRIPLIVGVSAGAINASFLAAHPGSIADCAAELQGIWSRLHAADIFRVDGPSLARHFGRWVAQLAAGGGAGGPGVRGLVDTTPLHSLIASSVATVDGEMVGIDHNLRHGRLKAVAITTLNYSTGQTVTWVQGRNLQPWTRPRHRSYNTRLGVDHVMASAALPLFFPAVRLGDAWHGDGGVRLDAPLASALHLGACRILAISPRYEMSLAEADRIKVQGYPPPAQILSQLMNSIFLDVIDRDARQLETINRLIAHLAPADRGGLRPVETLVLRPSEDLGLLAAAYEERLPHAFRHLTRSLGTRETEVPDFLSVLMFEPEYLERLMAIGERDAESRLDEIRRLVSD